jgi:hypothetical protein
MNNKRKILFTRMQVAYIKDVLQQAKTLDKFSVNY